MKKYWIAYIGMHIGDNKMMIIIGKKFGQSLVEKDKIDEQKLSSLQKNLNDSMKKLQKM